MNVSIKSFDVKMDVKNKGVEFEVRDTQNKFLGDCIVTKTGLTWCKGKITASKRQEGPMEQAHRMDAVGLRLGGSAGEKASPDTFNRSPDQD